MSLTATRPGCQRRRSARLALVASWSTARGLGETVRNEVAQACARYGGSMDGPADLVLALAGTVPAGVQAEPGSFGPGGFGLTRRDGVTVVLADEPAGLLYGLSTL